MKIIIDSNEICLKDDYLGKIYLFENNNSIYINNLSQIKYEQNSITFDKFNLIDNKNINHEINNITTHTYKYSNIIIGIINNYCSNNNDDNQLTYILIENLNIIKSLSEPITHIILNIYIGNLYSIVDTSILSGFEIKNIVQVFDDYIEPIPTINYLRIEISDDLTTDITRYFSDFINFIKKSNNNTLIHCQHGSSRSGSFVIFYLMYFHKMSLNDALDFARTKRYGINPNQNFLNQIKNYFIE